MPLLTHDFRRFLDALDELNPAQVERAMRPLVPGDAVLCSDGGNGYKILATARGLEHFVVGSKPGTRVAAGCCHIQNVNSLHARYDKFITPFCGPATKNLNGYIRWLEVRLAGVRPAGCDRQRLSTRRKPGVAQRSASSPLRRRLRNA